MKAGITSAGRLSVVLFLLLFSAGSGLSLLAATSGFWNFLAPGRRQICVCLCGAEQSPWGTSGCGLKMKKLVQTIL